MSKISYLEAFEDSHKETLENYGRNLAAAITDAVEKANQTAAELDGIAKSDTVTSAMILLETSCNVLDKMLRDTVEGMNDVMKKVKPVFEDRHSEKGVTQVEEVLAVYNNLEIPKFKQATLGNRTMTVEDEKKLLANIKSVANTIYDGVNSTVGTVREIGEMEEHFSEPVVSFHNSIKKSFDTLIEFYTASSKDANAMLAGVQTLGAQLANVASESATAANTTTNAAAEQAQAEFKNKAMNRL